jgi:GMC oxidoreductase/TAT (twin-arginine translocation) pathway signal sequence
MSKTPPVGRRDFLKMGVAGAGATLATGCGSVGLGRVPNADVDLATAAQVAYRRSLKALKRSLPLPDGTERSDVGSGTLAADHALLRAARGSRPGRADFDVLVIGSGYGGAVCAARVHAGIYVADASIVPTAIGNNPLLTIAALAERIADLIVTDPDHATLFEVPPTRHDPPMQSL